MMDRRKFVASLGAATILPVVPGALGRSKNEGSPASGSMRSRVDLNGEWERIIDGQRYDVISVPSSQHPVGNYTLQREFLLPRLTRGQRAVLHFDAITYYGRAFVNDAELGEMGPYIPYEFDCTRQVKEGSNSVRVEIADLVPFRDGKGRDELALGVSSGWEAYGGIIRDVYLELRPAAYIENVRLAYQLQDGYGRAACQARVYVSSPADAGRSTGRVEVSLWQGEWEVARGEKPVEAEGGISEVEVALEVKAPALWSPEEPNLYELRARLKTGEGEDQWSCRTGFREVVTRGRDFLLNGERLVLKGVGRHDMWKEQGFTLTRAQMEQDMRMIKALGANFVRLVHYPHHRRIVELADTVGLLVSEEPGYWGMDFKTLPAGMIELGYKIMERVIRRDWNSPSVFAWLLGNECNLTVEYLREGKRRCRNLDPLARPVSFANSMEPKEAKPIFEQAGMDFFDQHVYPPHPREYSQVAEFYGDSRPLTFTEWGWEDVGGGDIFPEYHTDLILDLVESRRLAGHVFWSWNDLRQYSRIDWPTRDGILLSGVVTEAREVRPDWYLRLTGLFQGRPEEVSPVDIRPRVIPLRRMPTTPGKTSYQPLDLQALADSPEGRRSWEAFEAALADYWRKSRMAQDQWRRTGGKFRLWQGSDAEIVGIPFRSPLSGNFIRPLMLTSEVPEITIPVNLECIRLHVLGQVTLPEGYPVAGARGEAIAIYSLRYANGRTQEIPVRNGIEVARANLIDNATRIDPIATAAPRALEFVKDISREHYQVLLWPVPTERSMLVSLHCRLMPRQPAMALFAITAERT